MKTKRRFLFNVLSYIILALGVTLGYWGISTTLFYFVIEASISRGIAAYWFKQRGRKRIGIKGALSRGIGVGLITLNFVFILTTLAGESHFSKDPDQSPRLDFFISMLVLTWPLIVYKTITTYLLLKDADKVQIEKTAWEEAIHSIMSIFIAFVLTLIFLRLIDINHKLVIICTLIIGRILFDVYLFRTVLGLKIKKS